MKGIHINQRALSCINSMQEELSFDPAKNYLFDLSYWECLAVEGLQSREYLQGQLTCDMHEVSAQQMRSGVLCNLKGRVLALMDVLDWQGIKLFLPQDMIADTQQSLSKTAMFSKVSLTRVLEYRCFGLMVSNKNDLLPDIFSNTLKPGQLHATNDYCIYNAAQTETEPSYFIIIIKHHINASWEDMFLERQQYRGSLAWHFLKIKRHLADIYPLSRGLFLPHRLHLHLSGHISFTKGCYKGQEIIARMHYRAVLKHELRTFLSPIESALTPGQVIYAEDNVTEIGELIDYCPVDDHNALLLTSIVKEYQGSIRLKAHHAKKTLS